MLLPVNNVEGKQQLNDQSHYSTRQIKGSRVSVAVFTCRRDTVNLTLLRSTDIFGICLLQHEMHTREVIH